MELLVNRLFAVKYAGHIMDSLVKFSPAKIQGVLRLPIKN